MFFYLNEKDIMPAITEIKNAQDSVFLIEDTLKDIIERQGEITDKPIKEFDTLVSHLETLSNIFFKEFENDYIKQIVTFGSIKTTSEICKSLRDNLSMAHEIGENPIAAERVIDKNYLGFISAILDVLDKVYSTKTISSDENIAINESVKSIFKMSLDDRILQQTEIKFTSSDSESIFINAINQSTNSVT